MSILCIGDMHYKRDNQMTTDIAEKNILHTINIRNPTFVIIMGDTLNDHGKAWLSCYHRACKFFDAIIATGKHLYVLIGNHERENQHIYLTDEHFFYAYKGKPGITIVDRCMIDDIPYRKFGVDSDQIFKMCLMPYVPADKILQSLTDCNINPLSVSAFFGHIDIGGSKTHKLAEMSGKKNWDFWPSNYPPMYSGHVHDEEDVTSNFKYLGCPYQQSFSETHTKGIFIINLLSPIFTLEKISLNTPRKIKYVLHYLQMEHFVIESGVDVKFDITGPKSQAREFMKRADMIAKFGHIPRKYIGEEKIDMNIPQLSHSCHFYEKILLGIQQDEELKNTFNYIFNSNNGGIVNL